MIVVVSDTSAISALLQVDEVHILEQLYGQILIPEAVQQELAKSHDALPAFIQLAPVETSSILNERLRELDKGEAYAITLAEQLHTDLLLIDEKKGRAVAARTGIPYMGLVGALIEAKRRKLIPNLKELLARVTADAGFRLAPSIQEAVLKAAGES